ncbi:MAG: high-potential iron-sulfur protein [Nevskia sp.]|nr:high-potential iron-sulfur protein [Nevskia sp.]
MSKAQFLTRRDFLARIALGTATLPLLQLAPAQAADLPHLSPDDPAAKALSYTENAAKVDGKAEPLLKAGSHCGSCNFYQAAQAKGDCAPCTIFPGKSVNKNGWCRAWAAKA